LATAATGNAELLEMRPLAATPFRNVRLVTMDFLLSDY
jgi:hypothetical protein